MNSIGLVTGTALCAVGGFNLSRLNKPPSKSDKHSFEPVIGKLFAGEAKCTLTKLVQKQIKKSELPPFQNFQLQLFDVFFRSGGYLDPTCRFPYKGWYQGEAVADLMLTKNRGFDIQEDGEIMARLLKAKENNSFLILKKSESEGLASGDGYQLIFPKKDIFVTFILEIFGLDLNPTLESLEAIAKEEKQLFERQYAKYLSMTAIGIGITVFSLLGGKRN